VLLVSMDMTVLHLAIPEITAELRPSATETLWLVDIYAFMVAGLLITMGGLGDQLAVAALARGRRPLLPRVQRSPARSKPRPP
jgi:MFS family permease